MTVDVDVLQQICTDARCEYGLSSVHLEQLKRNPDATFCLRKWKIRVLYRLLDNY
jgi:hypothetical protein